MSNERLNQLAVEMSGLCAELDRVEGLSKDELQHLSDKATDVISEMESEYGVTTLRPDVSHETQSMFFRLHKFVFEG